MTTRYAVYTHPYTAAEAPKNITSDLSASGTRPKGSTINVLERYATQEAFDLHVQSEPFKTLSAAFLEEGLLSETPGALKESWVKFLGGFGE